MSPLRRRGVLALALAALIPAAAAWGAQVEASPELRGRVLRGEEGLEGVRVVLHRVSADSAGEIDSVRTGTDGSFAFALPTVPDPGGRSEVYFASVRHQGILYFGEAVARAVQLDSLYLIRAWDTVPAPVGGADLPVVVRYLILDDIEDGWEVTDLMQVRVGAAGTLVARGDTGLTWRHPLPPGARNIQVGAGDAPSQGQRVAAGALQVRAPLSPGDRQFLLRYRVDELDGLRIPFRGPSDEVEVLVREPAPAVEVPGLTAVEPVQMEPGVEYRRWVGAFAADTTVVLALGGGPFSLPLEWLAVALGLVLALAGLWAVGRARGEPAGSAAQAPEASPDEPGEPPRGDARDRLLLEIARIEEELDAAPTGSRERIHLEERRRMLVSKLRGGR